MKKGLKIVGQQYTEERSLSDDLLSRLTEKCKEKIQQRLSKPGRILRHKYLPLNWHIYTPGLLNFYASHGFTLLVLFVLFSPLLAYLPFVLFDIIPAGVISVLILSVATSLSVFVVSYRCRPKSHVYTAKCYEVNPMTSLDKELEMERTEDYHFRQFMEAYIEKMSEVISRQCVIPTQRKISVDALLPFTEDYEELMVMPSLESVTVQ